MSKEIKNLGIIGLVVVIAVIVVSYYYQKSTPTAKAPVSSSNSTKKATGELIRPDSPTLGPADAKVTLVEFYDPECETCAVYGPIVKKILKENDGKIRLVARYMPLHPNSITAANFLEAAGEQGKYWQAMEILFQKQGEWGTKHTTRRRLRLLPALTSCLINMQWSWAWISTRSIPLSKKIGMATRSSGIKKTARASAFAGPQRFS